MHGQKNVKKKNVQYQCFYIVVLDGILSFVYDTEKKQPGSTSIKSPNILFRAVLIIDYLSLKEAAVTW